MRNGSGDEYSIVFFPGGAFVRGFAHESVMSPLRREPRSLCPGMTEGMPEKFQEFVDEPAFSNGDGVPLMTVVLWRGTEARSWSHGNIEQAAEESDDDGSGWLFEQLLDGSPRGYVDYARDYFGLDLELSDVAAVYEGITLTPEKMSSLNPARDWDELVEDLELIGYPFRRR
jgi:hypothetical protein